MKLESMTIKDVQCVVDKALGIVGPTLLGLACGITSRKELYLWATGDAHPYDDELERLLIVSEVLDIVTKSDGEEVARSWFMGSSCGPNGDQSPAEAIRVCNFDDARGSAHRLADNA